MRTRALLAAALTCAALTVVGAGVPTASADPPGAVGWWTQRPGATPRGDGGIEVAASIRGDESVAAIRVDALPGGATPGQLVLTQAAPPTGEPLFQACPATSPWQPADGGAFADRPQADCTAAVPAEPDGADGWTIELGSLLAGGTSVDLVLVPTPSELLPGISGIGFTVAFSGIDVVAATAPAPSTTIAPPTTAAVSAAPASSGGSGTASPAIRPAPLPAGVPTTFAGVGNDGSGGSLAAPVAPGATVPGIMFDLASNDEQRPWGRLLLLVPLSAGVGFAAAAARNAARERGLGATSLQAAT